MKKNYKQLLIWLLPLILLLGALGVGGLNLGVDFAQANVIQLKLTETITKQEINEIVSPIGKPAKIELFSDGQVNIFFQNVNLDSLQEFEDEFLESRSDMTNFQVFEYEPTTLIFINERILYGLFVAIVAYMGLISYTFRGKGILRYNLLAILIVDFLLIVSLLLSIFLSLNLLGYVGLPISASVITFGLSFLVYLSVMNLIIATLSKNESGSIVNRWKSSSIRFVDKALKFVVLVSLVIISTTAVEIQMLWMIPVFAFNFVYAVVLFTQIKLVLLAGLSSMLERTKFVKNSSLVKEW